MLGLAKDDLGWSAQRATAIQDALNRALTRTAKCRQVVPKGQNQLGQRAVLVRTIGAPDAGVPAALAVLPDKVSSPIHMYVDFLIDDARAADDGVLMSAVEAAAAQLGSLEDGEIIMGGTAGAPGVGEGRAALISELPRAQLNKINGAKTEIPNLGNYQLIVDAERPRPTGVELVEAIASGMATQQIEKRPGRYGLLLHSFLLATLGLPAAPGAAPFTHAVERLIGSSEITDTPALSGTLRHGRRQTGAILFRLDPPAVDTVHTMLPTLTLLGRNLGQTHLRIEEEIVVRILDQKAIHHITY